jgi:hypothetical protein
MKKQLFVICVFVTASFFNSKSFAQTFPSNYVPLSPQLVHGSFPLPDNSPFVLPTDLIEGFRSTALPNGGQDISEIGYLPLSAFASASQLTHFQQQLTTQLQQQDNLDRHGIATALAMTNASMPSAPDLTSWTRRRACTPLQHHRPICYSRRIRYLRLDAHSICRISRRVLRTKTSHRKWG